MMTDDLSSPLGQGGSPKGRRAFRISFSQIAIAALSVFALVFAAWAVIADDPFGGEPVAVVPVTLVAASPGNKLEQAGADLPEPAANGPLNSHDSSPVDSLASAPPVNKTVTIIDGTSGKRQEIVIPGTANFGSTDEQPAESTRRDGVAKAAPNRAAPSGAALNKAVPNNRPPGRTTPAP
jgi:uncharacterized protein